MVLPKYGAIDGSTCDDAARVSKHHYAVCGRHASASIVPATPPHGERPNGIRLLALSGGERLKNSTRK